MVLLLAAAVYLCTLVVIQYCLGPAGVVFQHNIHYKPHGYGHLHARLREAATTGPVDVIFLGSSHAYRQLDPRIFAGAGIRSFNLGSGSQSPLQSELLLRRYLDQLRPRLVVMDVFSSTFVGDGAESTVDLIASDDRDDNYWPLFWQAPRLIVLNAMLLDYFDRVAGIDPGPQPRRIKDDTYVAGGFVERDPVFYGREQGGPKMDPPVNPLQMAAFERLLALLAARDIPVLLVRSPVTGDYRRIQGRRESFDRLMAGYGDYLNFNERLPLVDTLHFYDDNHLNQLGVPIYNEALIDSIRKRGYLAAGR